MPLSGSINVAERIFFKILKKDALKKVKTKTQRKLFELLSEDESRVINIDDLTGDGQPFVSVYILKDVEEKIGKFLSVSEDLPIIVHPKLVARALRKVPEEDDRRAIASCIINKYIRMEERQNRKLSEEVGHSNLMTRESHHEGSTGYD